MNNKINLLSLEGSGYKEQYEKLVSELNKVSVLTTDSIFDLDYGENIKFLVDDINELREKIVIDNLRRNGFTDNKYIITYSVRYYDLTLHIDNNHIYVSGYMDGNHVYLQNCEIFYSEISMIKEVDTVKEVKCIVD